MTNGIIIPNWDNIYNDALRQIEARAGSRKRIRFIVWDKQSRRRYVFAIRMWRHEVVIWAPIPQVSWFGDYPQFVVQDSYNSFDRRNRDKQDIKKSVERLALRVSALYGQDNPEKWTPGYYPLAVIRNSMRQYRQHCQCNYGCRYSYHNLPID